MHFDEFLKYAPKILNVELPATKAHAKMVPPNREELIRNTDFTKITPKKAAVMMLFIPEIVKLIWHSFSELPIMVSIRLK